MENSKTVGCKLVKNHMKIYQILFFCLISFSSLKIIAASANLEITKEEEIQYKKQCLEDLTFFRKNIEENSAPFKDPDDQIFRKWFDEGYVHVQELIEGIKDSDDCYYAMKFYLNGFGNPYVSLREYIQLPQEQYPGFLTAKYGNSHIVIYKDPNINYLKNISIGNHVTHINDIPINDYFEKYIFPFYSSDDSEFSQKTASIFNFIVNGNRYVPIPSTANITDGKTKYKLDLKYTELSLGALAVSRSIKQPSPDQHFKVEMVSHGVWIAMPSFYLTREEAISYTGMLSKLKELAKEDYIVFDLRGNRGGGSVWARPIIRNLWGDDYIKHLRKNHDFNSTWIKKFRVSKQNFFDFKKTANALEVKSFAAALQNKEDFFEKKWTIFNEDLNLYTNQDSAPFKAKIFVFTDHFCRSTCWAFVNQLIQIPGVTHIGLPTVIQTNSSYAKNARSPSGNFDFFYPTEIRVYPNKNVGQALIPSKIFNGNILDESEVIDWVLSITEGIDKKSE